VPRLDELGNLFRAGHESLRRDFDVTTPELDLLVDLAYESGALAARMTGGGFGGSVVALTDPAQGEKLAGAVAAAYADRSGGSATVARVCHASGGAREL
jgi:galactokinase